MMDKTFSGMYSPMLNSSNQSINQSISVDYNRVINHWCTSSSLILGGPGLKPPLSVLQINPPFSFPFVDSPAAGLGIARSPAVKHFDAVNTLKQPYKLHIDV